MRGWVWWPLVGILGFIACGGTSMRRSAGDDDDRPSDDGSLGGASGSKPVSGGTGANGGTGGMSKGGAPTGGRGGTPATGGRGGGVPQGGVGNTSGDGGAGEPGGGAGAPTCELAGGSTCSAAATCTALGCGMPWSIYDQNLCQRQSCAESGLCEGGERCVIAPVAGGFRAPCHGEADSCEVTANGCECIHYEECTPTAICLSVDEFPADNDCPIGTLDCAGLEQAAATLEAHITGDGFFFPDPYELPGNLAASLEACAQAVGLRLEDCN
jgi:hypothetical protein